MESEERLSTRDIAGGGDTATDRDPTLADTPPADTAAAPPERTDRDYDDGGAVAADRAEPVDDGDVVTDEPTAARRTARGGVGASTPSPAGPAPARIDVPSPPRGAAGRAGPGDAARGHTPAASAPA